MHSGPCRTMHGPVFTLGPGSVLHVPGYRLALGLCIHKIVQGIFLAFVAPAQYMDISTPKTTHDPIRSDSTSLTHKMDP